MTATVYAEYYQLSGVSSGWRYDWDSGDWDRVSFTPSAALVAYGEVGSSFEYSTYWEDDGDLRADISFDDKLFDLTLNGVNLFSMDVDASIYAVDWVLGGLAHSSVILEIDAVEGNNYDEGYEYGSNYVFVLDGDPLPDADSLAEWVDFADTDKYITDYGPTTDDLGPGKTILWSDIANTELLGADEDFTGTPGKDVFNGGYGHDYFMSSEGNDIYDGGVGTFDQVTYKDDPAGVIANLATGKATDGWGDTDRFKGIEMLRGSLFDDKLTGDKGDNHIRGLAGDDVLNGGKGTDTLRYDKDASYGGTDGVTVNLKKGYAIDGFGDHDTLKKFENVLGTDSKDTITGTKAANYIRGDGGADVLKGLGGQDVLQGGNGNDKLFGGNGADVLFGDNGKDKLDGGKGDDNLYGGAKNDIFIFSGKFGNDIIHDFTTAGRGEKIDLSGVTSITGFKDLVNNHLFDDGPNSLIDDGSGNTIQIYYLTPDELAKNDFLF